MRAHFVDAAQFSASAADRAAREHHFLRGKAADIARQALHTGGSSEKADLDFGQRELGVLGGEDECRTTRPFQTRRPLRNRSRQR